ncbi:MAG: YqaE/Pmp3 family membrane protein [Opitutales bacterium]|nr:YqaE/Pmp3 family membrane protein [Opitutales bacterium]
MRVISIVLTILFYVPGLIHALYVVLAMPGGKKF